MRTAIVAAVVAAIVTIPTTVVATHLFTDVPDNHPHADGIAYAVETGITQGCGDGSRYCPDQLVTRDQMATFMHRQSGNADMAPSVNAGTLQGLEPGDLQRRVQNNCQDGTFLKGIRSDGTVECGTLELDVHVESYTDTGGSYVQCPVGFGYVATGGGFSTESSDIHIYRSQPIESWIDQGWTSSASLPDGSSAPMTSAFVVCVRLAPA